MRVSSQRLAQLSHSLSDRDRAILASVDRYGFLTSGQLGQLHFGGHASSDAAGRSCRRVLGRLRRERLLEPLERRIGGVRAGSAGYVWRIGPAGDRLLRATDVLTTRARRKEPSLRFLYHRLAVADVACRLTWAARQGRFELLQLAPEPASWRRFLGDEGIRDIIKPDLYAVTADAAYERHWFIEVDRATESLPTVLGQCAHYVRYRQSGAEQAAAHVFPRVLWLVPDAHRAEQLHQEIRMRLPDAAELFWTTVQTEVVEVFSGELVPYGADRNPRSGRMADR